MEINISNRRLSFIIAFAYVMAGTYFILDPANEMQDEGIIYYFFFPVTLIPQLIRLTEKDPFVLLLICQLITTGVLTFTLYGIITVLSRNKK